MSSIDLLCMSISSEGNRLMCFSFGLKGELWKLPVEREREREREGGREGDHMKKYSWDLLVNARICVCGLQYLHMFTTVIHKIYRSVCSINFNLFLSVHVSLFLSIYLSIYLSISVCSFFLSFFLGVSS